MNIYDYLSIFSYGMIAVSYMMREMIWLRSITVVTCLFDVVIYTLIRPGQPLWVQVIANVTILFINSYFLYKLIRERRGLAASEHELAIYRAHFAILSEVEFMRFFKRCRMVTYKEGALYKQGEKIERVMIVMSGSLTKVRDGVVVGTFEVGDVVGAASLLAQDGAVYTVICNGAVDVLEINLSEMDDLIKANPEMKASILAWKGYHVSRSILRGNCTDWNRNGNEFTVRPSDVNQNGIKAQKRKRSRRRRAAMVGG